jgi:hypothetical protein
VSALPLWCRDDSCKTRLSAARFEIARCRALARHYQQWPQRVALLPARQAHVSRVFCAPYHRARFSG